MHQNVHYISRSNTAFEISSQLDILCTCAVKRYYANNNNSLFTFYLFFFTYGVPGSKTLPPDISDFNLVNFVVWRVL